MQVRDVMNMKVYTVKPSNTLKDLLEILHTNRIGAVPVVDDRGNLVGMVSDGDVLRYLAPKTSGFAAIISTLENIEVEDTLQKKLETEVKDIMTKRNLKYVSPDDRFDQTLHLISKHPFNILPVVNGAGRVIGVLSRGDMISNISETILSS